MKIETILDHHTILENRRPQTFFAVRFHAPEIPTPATPSGAYCIVLDQSASIDGHAAERARRFSTQLIRHLQANALLSIVTFDETAEAIFDLAPVADKSALQALVNNIESIDYGTNLSAGLLLAREQLHHAPPSIVSKKILLFTDGEHTAGVRDEKILEQFAIDCRAQGIQITTLHLGHTNPAFMDRISSTYYPNLTGENLLATVGQELGALQPIAAQNLRLRLKPLEFCEKIEPLGFNFTERSDAWLTTAIGDLLSSEERILCFNLTIPLLPCIDDQPCASLANEALLELEVGYEAVATTGITPKIFSTTVRIPALSNTSYPNSEDGSLTLRDGA
jgi:hypothetical protein